MHDLTNSQNYYYETCGTKALMAKWFFHEKKINFKPSREFVFIFK